MASSSVWNKAHVETDYAWQTFFDALGHAITSTGSLQQRLASLVWSVCELRRQNFPDDETWIRFHKFVTATTGHPVAAAKPNIKTITLRMKDDEARQWLHEALQIFSNLSEETDI